MTTGEALGFLAFLRGRRAGGGGGGSTTNRWTSRAVELLIELLGKAAYADGEDHTADLSELEEILTTAPTPPDDGGEDPPPDDGDDDGGGGGGSGEEDPPVDDGDNPLFANFEKVTLQSSGTTASAFFTEIMARYNALDGEYGAVVMMRTDKMINIGNSEPVFITIGVNANHDNASGYGDILYLRKGDPNDIKNAGGTVYSSFSASVATTFTAGMEFAVIPFNTNWSGYSLQTIRMPNDGTYIKDVRTALSTLVDGESNAIKPNRCAILLRTTPFEDIEEDEVYCIITGASDTAQDDLYGNYHSGAAVKDSTKAIGIRTTGNLSVNSESTNDKAVFTDDMDFYVIPLQTFAEEQA